MFYICQCDRLDKIYFYGKIGWMSELYRVSMLLDFYGELLTKTQFEVMSEHIYYDLTITEIANNRNVSRQNIHESIKRSQSILEGYESKLGLVKKFDQAKNEIKDFEMLISKVDLNVKLKKEMLDKIHSILEKF